MVMPFLLVDVYSVLRPREFCNALFSSLLYFAAFWVKLETNAFLTGVFLLLAFTFPFPKYNCSCSSYSIRDLRISY